MFHILSFVFALCVGSSAEAQPGYNLRFVLITNNGTHYDVRIQINGSARFKNGGSNICFNFNTSSLDSQALVTAHNFTSGAYSAMKITSPAPGIVSINTEYNGAAGNGDTVTAAPGWTDLATIRFKITNPSGASNLSFRATNAAVSPTVQYLDDLTTLLPGGTFLPLNTSPLPVTFLNCYAEIEGNDIRITWSSIGERDLIGYTIERRAGMVSDWVERGLVPVTDGRNVRENEYLFRDPLPIESGCLKYRIRAREFSGAEYYSPEMTVLNVGRIGRSIRVFPNPNHGIFDLEYLGDIQSPVTLRIIDAGGRVVCTSILPVSRGGVSVQRYNVSFLSHGIFLMSVEDKFNVQIGRSIFLHIR